MNEVKNYEAVKEIASKHLGKVGGDGYSDQYNPELLVKIPRKLNREGYNLTGKESSGEYLDIDIWYDENLEWVKMRFLKDDSIINYILDGFDEK